MSKKRNKTRKSRREKLAEPQSVTHSKFRLAVILASAGLILMLAGLLLGRGTQAGTDLYAVRLFLLGIGFCLLLAGAFGLLSHALVLGANRQLNKTHGS